MINAIKNLITNNETSNATKHPTNKKITSFNTIAFPEIKNLTILSNDAPNITGILKKNENSEATSLLHNKSIAPKIVTPLLDVPGIKARS